MKNTLILLALVSITQTIVAQTEKRFYLNTNIGYNKGTGNINYYQAQLLGLVNATQTSATEDSYEIVKTNLGQGINFGLNFGYMFNKNLGFELGANYLLSSEINSSTTSLSGNYNKIVLVSKMLQIKPTVVLRGGFEKINPYAKVGMVIGSGKIINDREFKDGSDISITTLELYDGTPIGFHSSVGVLYQLSSKFSVFGELNLVSLEYAANKGKYTKYIDNGADILPLLSIREIEIEFIESESNASAAPPSNQPGKLAKLPLSFNSFGLNIGLQYQF